MTNQEQVVCVYADKIEYMVIQPIILGEIYIRPSLTKYEATLIGVVVGGKTRPVDPLIRTLFVTRERVPGAAALGKA